MKYCFKGKGLEEPSLQAVHIVFVHCLREGGEGNAENSMPVCL